MSAGVWVWRQRFTDLWDNSGHFKKSRTYTPLRNGCRWNEAENVCLLAGYVVEQKTLPQLAHRHQRGANAIAIQMDRLQTVAMQQPTRPLLECLASCGLLTFKEPEMAAPLTEVLQAYADGKEIEYAFIDSHIPYWATYKPQVGLGLPDPRYIWRIKPETSIKVARVYMVPSKLTSMGAAFLHDPTRAPNLELQFIDNKLVGATVL